MRPAKAQGGVEPDYQILKAKAEAFRSFVPDAPLFLDNWFSEHILQAKDRVLCGLIANVPLDLFLD